MSAANPDLLGCNLIASNYKRNYTYSMKIERDGEKAALNLQKDEETIRLISARKANIHEQKQYRDANP
jgi:hypothetical protein